MKVLAGLREAKGRRWETCGDALLPGGVVVWVWLLMRGIGAVRLMFLECSRVGGGRGGGRGHAPTGLCLCLRPERRR